MGFFNKLLNEFVDIIEWTNPDDETIVWKFPRYQDEIKMGAKLTVRESQVAIFMNEGTIADVYQPGMYTLSTQNMPILSTLRGWKYGFDSPFKADVFFVSTRQFINKKWGTKNPAMIRDAEFGPVRLRAYGSFSFKVTDATLFLKDIVGTKSDYSTEDINEHLRNILVSRSMDAIASSGVGVLDLASHHDEVSAITLAKIQPDFNEIGLTLSKYLIENVSLPPEVESILDKRTGMGIVGNINAFAQFQAANSIEIAAANPAGGVAGAGIGLGMGVGMMNQMGNVFNPATAPAAPPPLPASVEYYVAVDGKQTGPYGIPTLREMAKNGTLKPDSMAWKTGMANWEPANTQTELQALFASVPPPLNI